MTRNASIAAFLSAHGYNPAHAAPLAQDASFRRYLRLTVGPRPALLMDAPPPEDIRPFIHIARHLAAIGLSVPDIIAADVQAGLLIEEDLGDALFSTIDLNAPLFDAAVDALIVMQSIAPPDGLPAWGAAEMASTALATLFDWWWPASFGSPAPDAARADIGQALEAMLAPVAAGPTAFVHRDFFAGNLIWLPARPGIRRVGIIDFQGAAIGHPAYDLVSLVQDARRDIAPDIETRAIARYLAARPDIHPDAFRDAFAACAAQRHLRVAAQWVRLAQRDHRPQYLGYGPRTWRLLNRALLHPATAPLAAALDRWLPPETRRNPPGLAAA